MKRYVVFALVFSLGFAVCWLYHHRHKSPANVGEPTQLRQVEITVPSSNPDRAGFSDTYNATITAIRDGEDECIVATGETNKPAMKVVLIARDGRRVSLVGMVEPR